MQPHLSRSYCRKARITSSRESRWLIALIRISRNSLKSIRPEPVVSTLAIIAFTSSFPGSRPSARSTTLSASGPMTPAV
eukprot:scaffold136511_cov35-Tisochrysis_lutea.AAC.2